MINIVNMNNNILARRWKERYESQSESVRSKLDTLSDAMIKEYQLTVIKRSRNYPEIGDIFRVCPREGIEYFGVVVNNHVSIMSAEDMIVVLILRKGVDIKGAVSNGIRQEDLLIEPTIVSRLYWTKGYFFNVDHVEIMKEIDYGFYDSFRGKFRNEYGQDLQREPDLLGTYGLATDSGIAYGINQEMIISGEI